MEMKVRIEMSNNLVAYFTASTGRVTEKVSKKLVAFATSGGSGIGKTAEKIKPYVSDTTDIVDAKLFSASTDVDELKKWVDEIL